MECDDARQAISAGLDNEEPGLAPDALDRHLDGCPACRSWRAAAIDLHRAVRVRPAEPVPDLTAAVMAAVGGRAQEGSTPAVIRLTLALIAGAEILIALPALTGNDLGAPIHVAHEQGAWTLALAAALAMAAWRPSRAPALIPLLGVFVACLSVLTVIDIAGGRVAPSAEIPHLMSGFGLLLVWLEGHPPAGLGPRPEQSTAPPTERVAA